MPLWPLPTAAPQAAHPMVSTASAWSTNVSTHATTAHTMGDWVELVASTPIDADFVSIRFGGHSLGGSASPALMDFAVGSAGSELVVLPTVEFGSSATHHTLMFPLHVPAGSRIAARAQGALVATNTAVTVALYGGQTAAGGMASAQKWTAYGVSAATSSGTQVQPNASANTWGSWVEVATTGADHDWWTFTVDIGTVTVVRAVTNLLQLAAGPDATAASACATSGTLLGELNVLGVATPDWEIQQSVPLPRYAPVPSGTKLWARLQTSNATDNDLWVSVYGGS